MTFILGSVYHGAMHSGGTVTILEPCDFTVASSAVATQRYPMSATCSD